MKSKIAILSFLLVVNMTMLWITTYLYHNSQIENKQLKKQLISLSEWDFQQNNNIKNNQNNQNQKNNDKYSENNHNQLLIPDFPEKFWNLPDPFEEIQKFEEEMNRMFQWIDNNFKNRFKINVIPKSWNYFHFENTQIINWNKFYYSINLNWNHVSWKVEYNIDSTLKQLQQKIEKLWLHTDLKQNSLTFHWQIDNVNKLLQLFNINFEENSNQIQQNPEQNWIRRF